MLLFNMMSGLSNCWASKGRLMIDVRYFGASQSKVILCLYNTRVYGP